MREFLHGTGIVILWLLPLASVMLGARRLLKIPDELFRKLLRFLLMGVYIIVLYSFETWWIAAIFAASLTVLLIPILTLAGKIPHFSTFVNERKQGEFCHSMILAFSTMAAAILICWGWLGDRLFVLVCIYAWGIGDGFAALVGKRFGRHKIRLKFADHRKTWEGSAAMFVTSAAAVLTVLLIRGGLSVGSCLVIALAGAAASTLAELCSKNGYDTVICPAAAAVVILPLAQLMGR